jgi:hypothetical protein
MSLRDPETSRTPVATGVQFKTAEDLILFDDDV